MPTAEEVWLAERAKDLTLERERCAAQFAKVGFVLDDAYIATRDEPKYEAEVTAQLPEMIQWLASSGRFCGRDRLVRELRLPTHTYNDGGKMDGVQPMYYEYAQLIKRSGGASALRKELMWETAAMQRVFRKPPEGQTSGRNGSGHSVDVPYYLTEEGARLALRHMQKIDGAYLSMNGRSSQTTWTAQADGTVEEKELTNYNGQISSGSGGVKMEGDAFVSRLMELSPSKYATGFGGSEARFSALEWALEEGIAEAAAKDGETFPRQGGGLEEVIAGVAGLASRA